MPSETPLDFHSRRLAEALARSAAQRTNEMELREDIDPIVREAARELYGLDDLQVTAERRYGGRPYDKAYGGVVVEWEWRMDNARRRDGAEQAFSYLGSMRREVGLDRAFTAVVCDGLEWGFLTSDQPPDEQPSLLEPAPETDVERFVWVPNSEAACRRFLELLGSHEKAPLTSQSLIATFGPASTVARTTLTLLLEGLRARDPDDRIDTLFREWRRLLEVVYGDLDDTGGALAGLISETYGVRRDASLGELLFGLHTYFGLVIRLSAIELLAISSNESEVRPTTWAALDDEELVKRLKEVDRGDLPLSIQVSNLFEGDVFSWYLDALEGSVDLVGAVRDVLGRLSGFAFPRVAYGANPATDILRDLYQALVPRELRRRLGEFLTPHWLAEAVIEDVALLGRVDVHSGRVLDPTCGTGTFLVPLVAARVRSLRLTFGGDVPEEAIDSLTRSVVGYDINPIAVLAARVNYLIALGDLAGKAQRLTLPIWRADSILVPQPSRGTTDEQDERLLGRTYVTLQTSLEAPFPIPGQLSDAPGLTRLGRIILDALEQEGDDSYEVDEFLDEFDAEIASYSAEQAIEPGSEDWDEQRAVAAALYERILTLKRDERNGVWVTIIQNNFAPRFEGRFDLVIGNPPWLTWTRLPETWREAAGPLWRDYGLWRVPREAGPRSSWSLASSDLAILVYAAAIERYARERGTVALLAPRSLISADPGGRAFRQFHLIPAEQDALESRAVDVPFRAYGLTDFSRLNPFSPDASNQPILLVSQRDEGQTYPVPTKVWRRATQGARLSGTWAAVRNQLTASRGESAPVSPQVRTSAWSFRPEGAVDLLVGGESPYPFGKGLDTRGANGVYFVEALEDARNDGTILIANLPSAGRATVRVRRRRVATDLVWPLLRGQDVSRWQALPGGLIVAPHDPEDLSRVLTVAELRERPGATYRFLRDFRERLMSRSRYQNFEPTEACYWMLSGPLAHMAGSHIVVVREIQNTPAAAVVTSRFSEVLGRTTPPLIEHKLLFSSVSSEQEAYYLAGCINSAAIQDLLASFANPIAISPQTMRRLPIPTFDPELHSGIVTAARSATSARANANDDQLVLAESALGEAFLAAHNATEGT